MVCFARGLAGYGDPGIAFSVARKGLFDSATPTINEASPHAYNAKRTFQPSFRPSTPTPSLGA